jgi:hypothetical protein
MNTSTIFDDSKQLISDLYAARLGDMDINVPEIQRAVLELKLYHLPPLHEIPAKIRNRVALRPEVSLFQESELLIMNKAACPSCFNVRPLYGEHTVMCLECWSAFLHALWKDFPVRIQNWTQILNCTSYIPDTLLFITKESWAGTIEASTLKELLAGSRAALRYHPITTKTAVECWTTPKKAFLIQEIGCLHCKAKPDFREVGWLWSADFSDWMNGYCPLCIDIAPTHQTVWGMTDNEYRIWQDSYTNTQKMQRTIARYGALSLLLVSTSANWANYITKVVPHATAYSLLHQGTRLSPSPLGHLHHTRAHTLSELSINLDDVLPEIGK